MSPGRTEALGVLLAIAGCVWFAFSTIGMPPLTLLYVWLYLEKTSDLAAAVLIRCDYLIPALVAASGLVLKRSASQKPTRVFVATTYGIASAFVLTVLVFWGFIRLH